MSDSTITSTKRIFFLTDYMYISDDSDFSDTDIFDRPTPTPPSFMLFEDIQGQTLPKRRFTDMPGPSTSDRKFSIKAFLCNYDL